MNDNLDTARDILEKALEPLFLPFSRRKYEKIVEDMLWSFSNDSDSMETWNTRIAPHLRKMDKFFAAREEKQKEAIKLLDIEKLIKLIREA
ncbi:MAG TPA: hypothetical protein VIJ14_00915 [Rhabdochlamydiaceae bacterium]